MSSRTIKQELIASGRFDECCEILSNIVRSKHSEFAIRPIIDTKTNEVLMWVTKDDVIKAVNKWYELIHTTGEHITEDDTRTMEALHYLVDTDLDMKLHNYANACAHRKTPDEGVLEHIRAFAILNQSVTFCLGDNFDIETKEFCEFTIPDGWKKVA